MKIIYIAGSGHSGSTLLGRVLGASLNSIYVGELKSLRKKINEDGKCVCGKKLKECPFWSKIIKRINPKNLYKKEKNKLKSMTEFFFNTKSKRKDDLYKIIFEKSQKDYIIDSSKEPRRIKHIAKNNPFIIHLVRDGRAQINSQDKLGGDFIKRYIFWVLNNLLLAIYTRRFNHIRISYDKFTKNPQKYIEFLNKKIGLEIDTKNYIDEINKKNEHFFGTNKMGYKKISEIKYDQKWKREIPMWKQMILTVLCYIPNLIWVYNDTLNKEGEENATKN